MKIENVMKGILAGIVVCFVIFAGSCAMLINEVSKCQGLKGVTEAVWEGTACEDE